VLAWILAHVFCSVLVGGGGLLVCLFWAWHFMVSVSVTVPQVSIRLSGGQRGGRARWWFIRRLLTSGVGLRPLFLLIKSLHRIGRGLECVWRVRREKGASWKVMKLHRCTETHSAPKLG